MLQLGFWFEVALFEVYIQIGSHEASFQGSTVAAQALGWETLCSWDVLLFEKASRPTLFHVGRTIFIILSCVSQNHVVLVVQATANKDITQEVVICNGQRDKSENLFVTWLSKPTILQARHPSVKMFV